MNIKKTLQNPFVLVGQGFVVGAILFFATTPQDHGTAPSPAAVQAGAAIESFEA